MLVVLGSVVAVAVDAVVKPVPVLEPVLGRSAGLLPQHRV